MITYEDTNTIYALCKKQDGRNVLKSVSADFNELRTWILERAKQINANEWTCNPKPCIFSFKLKDSDNKEIIEEYEIRLLFIPSND